MRARLLVAATAALVFGASIGCAQALPFNLADFTFTPSGDITGLSQSPTSVTVSELSTKTQRPADEDAAFLNSTFSVSGDFTATVTQTYNIAPNVSDLSGNQVIAAVEVTFAGNPNGVMLAASIDDGNGFFYLSNLDDSLVDRNVEGSLGLGASGNIFQFKRVGDNLSLCFSVGGFCFSTIDPNDVGAASFAFYYENANDNTGAGSVTWSDFSVATSATPLPAALPLFAGGLGALGLLGGRRKRKVAGTIVPA